MRFYRLYYTIMLENRRYFRLREHLDVVWKVNGQEDSGEGTVVNISLGGMLLQTDRMVKLADNSIVSIESGQEALPFAPKKGKIVWFRRINTPEERLQCGVMFLKDQLDRGFENWFETKVNRLSETTDVNILSHMAF